MHRTDDRHTGGLSSSVFVLSRWICCYSHLLWRGVLIGRINSQTFWTTAACFHQNWAGLHNFDPMVTGGPLLVAKLYFLHSFFQCFPSHFQEGAKYCWAFKALMLLCYFCSFSVNIEVFPLIKLLTKPLHPSAVAPAPLMNFRTDCGQQVEKVCPCSGKVIVESCWLA